MNADKTESVKLKSDVVQLARNYKAKKGVPVKIFIENAIIEKDKRLKSKKKL
jgi:hypothetical protein